MSFQAGGLSLDTLFVDISNITTVRLKVEQNQLVSVGW